MARPPYDGEIHRFRVTLCLREGEHDDLIAALKEVEPGSRAATVIYLMRQGVVGVVDTVADEEEAAEVLAGLFF